MNLLVIITLCVVVNEAALPRIFKFIKKNPVGIDEHIIDNQPIHHSIYIPTTDYLHYNRENYLAEKRNTDLNGNNMNYNRVRSEDSSGDEDDINHGNMRNTDDISIVSNERDKKQGDVIKTIDRVRNEDVSSDTSEGNRNEHMDSYVNGDRYNYDRLGNEEYNVGVHEDYINTKDEDTNDLFYRTARDDNYLNNKDDNNNRNEDTHNNNVMSRGNIEHDRYNSLNIMNDDSNEYYNDENSGGPFTTLNSDYYMRNNDDHYNQNHIYKYHEGDMNNVNDNDIKNENRNTVAHKPCKVVHDSSNESDTSDDDDGSDEDSKDINNKQVTNEHTNLNNATLELDSSSSSSSDSDDEDENIINQPPDLNINSEKDSFDDNGNYITNGFIYLQLHRGKPIMILLRQGYYINVIPKTNSISSNHNIYISNSKDTESSYIQLARSKSRWKGCHKSGNKNCKKACRAAVKSSCTAKKCEKKLKKNLKKECKTKCKDYFLSYN